MKSPRIYVSLDPELHEIVRRIAVGSGQSASGYISSMLSEQREVLSQIADAIDHARKLSGPISGSLTVALAKGEDRAQRALFEGQEALDELKDNMAQEAIGGGRGVPQARERAASAPRPSDDPLAINKGVFTKGVKSR